VDDILDRRRRLTWAGANSRPYSRKRIFTSPTVFPGGTRRLDTERVGLEMLREEQSGASSEGEASSTSSAAEVEVREVIGQAGLQRDTTGRSQSVGRGGEGVLGDVGRWRSRHFSHGDAVKSRDHHPSLVSDRHPSVAAPEQAQVLDSLHTINSQLGELLDRVGGAPVAPPVARMSMPAATQYSGQQTTFLPEESTSAPSNTR
jgi:hypothetical protein